jgi:hypothetical protein
MSIKVPTAAQLAVGSFNATSTSDQIGWGVDVATRRKTTWGSGEFEEYVPSLRTLALSVGGYNDFDAAAWDEYARTAWGSAQIVTLAYDGATAGTGAIVANGLLTNAQNANAAVGDISRITANVVGSTVYPPVAEGQVTRASSTNITATTTTTPVQVGALASTQYVVAAVHVFSYSGTGNITCQLQSSSTSGGSYTNRGSAGSAITAAGAQWLSATGLTVTDTWWRLNITASASPVAAVLASIAIFTP